MVPRPQRVTAGFSAVYLSGQAVLVVAWWVALAVSPALRDRFEMSSDLRDVLNALLVADIVVLAMGSALCAWLVVRRSELALAALAFVAGGFAYSTLHLTLWVSSGHDGWLGLIPMWMATAITAALAIDQASRR